MFGYSAVSLQKDKIENSEKELKSQKKLFNISIFKLEQYSKKFL